MKAYKGFNKDMTCRGKKYEEGKEYQEESAIMCEKGMHACEYPLDVFSYYPPSEAVYHEVEVNGDIQKRADKIVCTQLTVGANLNIAGMVKAAIEYTKSKIKPESSANGYKGASSATGYYGASSATGDYGASSATGYHGASSATGDKGASSATGDYGASSATGDYGASSAKGYHGASSATGDYGASSATGYKGASSATGYKGASSATGDYGASSATGNCGASSATGYKGASEANDPCAIAVSWGYHGKAKGVLGSYIVLAEWDGNKENYWTQTEWELLTAKMARVDGVNIKEDTWYTLINGEFVEVE